MQSVDFSTDVTNLLSKRIVDYNMQVLSEVVTGAERSRASGCTRAREVGVTCKIADVVGLRSHRAPPQVTPSHIHAHCHGAALMLFFGMQYTELENVSTTYSTVHLESLC